MMIAAAEPRAPVKYIVKPSEILLVVSTRLLIVSQEFARFELVVVIGKGATKRVCGALTPKVAATTHHGERFS